MYTVFLYSITTVAAPDPEWRYQENPQEYENMTMETYEIALNNALQREKVAKEKEQPGREETRLPQLMNGYVVASWLFCEGSIHFKKIFRKHLTILKKLATLYTTKRWVLS